MIENISDSVKDRVPPQGRIEKPPFVALKDGHLVIVVDYEFDDVPNWVEWEAESDMLSITMMSGLTFRMKADILPEHVQTMKNARKLLLVSNHGDKKIVHYVFFLTRD